MTAQSKVKEVDLSHIKTTPIMIALMIGGFIGLFSETALNMAFTNIMAEFQISLTSVQWLTTGYLLVLGILVPVSGLLIQWFTTRQLFIASLVFSIIGTLIVALAPNYEFVLFARVIQAIGTGLLLPLMTNVILVIFPPAKRGAAMGTIGLVIMFAPALGPTLSGLIVESLGWQWIFWICLPLLLFALGFGIVFMQNVSTITKPKIDILSIILSTIGFGGIVLGFSAAGEGTGGWSSSHVVVPLIIGAISLVLFGIRQFKMEKPMINLRVFKYPMFTIGILLVFLCMMIILSTAILLPMYLKGSLLLTSLVAGFVLLPGGAINGIMSPITGRLFDHFGPKGLVIPGFVLTTIMLWFFKDLSTTSSISLIVGLNIGLMIAISMIMMPSQTNGLNQLPREYYPDGAAVMNTLQQIAGAIGTAIAISIMSAGQRNYLMNTDDPTNVAYLPEAMTAGIQGAFTFALVASVIGLVASIFIKRIRV